MTQETDQFSPEESENVTESGEADGNTGDGQANRPATLVYSRRELFELRPSHLCSIKPASFALLEKNGVTCLRSVKKKKPLRCVYQKSGHVGSDARHEGSDAPGAARKSGDPRERLRAEEEGIVLSPQRRSFVSGCHAPSIKLKDDDADRESGQPSKPMRRMGSGRMIPREEMRAQGRGVLRYERYDSRLDKSDHRQEDKSRQDRRVASRDWQHSGGGGAIYNRQRRGNGSYGSADHRHADSESQPEWFSEGPTSQLEMIELCGFDPPDEKEAVEGKEKDKREQRDHGKGGANVEKQGETSESAADDKLTPSAAGAFMDDPAISSTVQQHLPLDPAIGVAPSRDPRDPGLHLDQMALDDILQLDLDSLEPAAASAQPAAASRFRQWFRQRSPSPARPGPDAARGDNSNGMSAGSTNTLFAPISPATGSRTRESVIEAVNRASSQQSTPAPVASTSGPSFDSLALASKLANMASGMSSKAGEVEMERESTSAAPVPRSDADALQRLMRQLCESEQPSRQPSAAENPDGLPVRQSAAQANSPLPVPLASTLPAAPSPAHHVRFPAAVAPSPGRAAYQPHLNVTQENLIRLLHVQHQQQQQQHVAIQLPADQLLATADARAVLAALQSGRVTRQHLIQQLHTKNLPTRTRDVLVAVLRLPQQLPGPPGPGSAVDALLLSQHQQQPAPQPQLLARTVSPLLMPPHHVHQQPAVRRVPSPQEMRVHTQNILQSALIKQKLEEQKENFRRRQVEHRHVEMMLHQQDVRHRAALAAGAGMAPGPVVAPAASALAFTPTAVIRNMQSEARTSPEHRPPGRAIVKSSMNGPEMVAPPGPWPLQQSAVDAGSLSRWFGSQLVSGTVAPAGVGANPRVFSVEELERNHRFA